ncbi:T9SS type A sorting domain-containing protein [Faecalibacter macacae]|uniref:T9SS C-terminal target domain-containing protein n=1 Tax=Faecalibacter macacae TaxID=1859289 RepID=A0A3L9MCS9_9FLAO|nr:T9SS type A sorting domain-containing protein [Faecalibacter macacae]RLZ08329.1 T9SS C-terminal target domain-containing protein [Faecalibacter macacae]
MLKYFTLILITTSSILFGQTDSQTDKDAIISLYSKLKRYQDGYFSRPLNQIYGLTTEVINNEYRVTKIDLPSSVNITNGTNVSITQDLVTDLHSDLNQLTEIKEIIISPEARYSSIVNNSNFNQDYKVDFNQLTNLQKLEKFEFNSFNNTTAPKINVIIQNSSSINSFPTLKILNLSNLKEIEINTIYNNINELKISSSKYNYSLLENITGPIIKRLELDLVNTNMENIDFYRNFPILEDLSLNRIESISNNIYTNTLKKLKLSGDFSNLSDDIQNASQLNSLEIKSYNLYYLPNSLHNLNNLTSLHITSYNENFIALNNSFSQIPQLKNLYINTNGFVENIALLNNLNELETLNLYIPKNYVSNIDFINHPNLRELDYLINYAQLSNLQYDDYILPLNIDQLQQLKRLYLTIGNSANINFNNLQNLEDVNIHYINPHTLPKLDFKNNTNLKSLQFYGNGTFYYTNNIILPTIEFENNYFNNLTNLEKLVYWSVPVKMNLTNMFVHNTNLKNLAFSSLSLNPPIISDFTGILNLCNNPNVRLQIYDQAPITIDLRNNINTTKYFTLETKSNVSPNIIVDDIPNFRAVNGNNYYNHQTNASESFNLINSSEPCSRQVLNTSTITNPISIDIYPNPTTDILYIETNSNENLIKIYNFNGQLVQSLNFNINKGSIMVDNLKQGIYIIEIENQNGKVSKKFIKI